jgi:hypothetical protein
MVATSTLAQPCNIKNDFNQACGAQMPKISDLESKKRS